MAVEDQVAAVAHPPQELQAGGQLGGVRPSQAGDEPLEEVFLGQRQEMVVEQQDARRSGRGAIQRFAHPAQVLGPQQPVGVPEAPVVQTGRVETDHPQASGSADLDAR